jgi:hypothetical protein
MGTPKNDFSDKKSTKNKHKQHGETVGVKFWSSSYRMSSFLVGSGTWNENSVAKTMPARLFLKILKDGTNLL